MADKITVNQAREYFTDPSQQLHGITDKNLPDEGFEYWADGPVCGVFHRVAWPGVFMCHYGVKPEGWGKLVKPAKRILEAFWGEHNPKRLIGWTPDTNTAALGFAKRLGFTIDGEMDLGEVKIIMQGWVKWE